MRGIGDIHPGWGLAIVRIAMGLILVLSGWGKLVGGVGGVAEAFGGMGVPLPAVVAPFVVVLELAGGALLLLGLAGRWVALLFAIQFAYITFALQLPGQGWEAARLDVMLLAGALLIFLAGSGRASVDAAWLEREAEAPGRRRPA